MSKQNPKKILDYNLQLFRIFCVHDHLTGQHGQQFNKKWKTIKVSENRSVETEKYLKDLKNAISIKRHSPGSIV
jgi:hypothetical protein